MFSSFFVVIKFGKKYKSNVENEKCLEGFPYVIGSFAKKLAEKNVSTTDALLNIAIETCEEFNLKNDLFNLYKQKSHLHYEKTKNYEIALKSAEYMVHYHKDLQQLGLYQVKFVDKLNMLRGHAQTTYPVEGGRGLAKCLLYTITLI